MNIKGGFTSGMMFTIVAAILVLSVFALISPFKENMDTARGLSSTLNCPGTPDFDQTDFNNDTTSQKLIRRPTCFVTGMSLIWFVGAYLISVTVWLFGKWVKGG